MEHMLVKWRKMWVRAVSLNGVSGGYMCRRVNQHPGREERWDVSGFPGVTSQLFKCVFKSVCVVCILVLQSLPSGNRSEADSAQPPLFSVLLPSYQCPVWLPSVCKHTTGGQSPHIPLTPH